MKIGARTHLHPSVDLFAFNLLFAQAEWCLALNHLIQQASETEPIGRERIFLVVDDLGRHVS